MISLPIIACLFSALPSLGEDPPPFRVPEGFVVSKYAGDELAHDIWAMTIDNRGRIVVCGPGYVKILLDTDGDGAADKARLFTDQVRGAQGLHFEGDDLIAAEQPGLFVYRDRDGDGVADGEREKWMTFHGGGEHGAHAIRKGPDGWFYVMVGNGAGVDDGHVTLATSPIKHPSQGCVLRIAPDGSASEVIAHGFRNAYDLAINKHGDLFTYDSDGERDHQLPWYSYTRVFHVRVGGHHGWLLGGWRRSFNRPDYFFDSVDRLISIDRGSPTGVEIYRHTAFPQRYRDGLFFACWTYGRIYFTPLIRRGETYEPHEPETFMQTTGNVGFPESGDMFVAIGGRGTQGAVYRVSYPAGREGAHALPAYETPADWSIHDQRIHVPEALEPPAALALFEKGAAAGSQRELLDGLRHLMLNLDDIYTAEQRQPIDAGYTANEPEAFDDALRRKVIDTIARPFPTGHHDADYEIARLLGMLHAEDAAVISKVAAMLRTESHPTDDAHYLFCLVQMPGERDEAARRAIAGAFLRIDQKIDQRKLLTDRNWSRNIRDALEINLSLDADLEAALGDHPAFGHPTQTYLLTLLSEPQQKAAARTMLERHAEERWSAQAIGFALKLPPAELLPVFRQQWQYPELRPALVSFLTTHGDEGDRKRLEEAFRPAAARIDAAPFLERLNKVNWSAGDAQRGQALFARFTCVACHSGNQRLGPDLKRITRRFGREDLFRHINDPNLSISDLYKATEITTTDGQTYIGVPVYQSAAQTIMEVGTGQTIRFSEHDILSAEPATNSPMPQGLLTPATDEELADLYAYLLTL